MSVGSRIEWCDATFNPWWGCEKVSPGCAHCYAERDSNRFVKGIWGADHAFRFFGDHHWNEPLRWARTLPEKLGRRPRVFTASMADVFEDRPELLEPRSRLFDLIRATPELDWLVLTKRPDVALRWFDEHWPDPPAGPVHLWAPPLPNVWMGVSIENARHTWRADVLREIPAAVRFLSCEPLLGSLTQGRAGTSGKSSTTSGTGPSEGQGRSDAGRKNVSSPATRVAEGPSVFTRARAPLDLTGIDWVIVGGESGPGARPMHPDWAREIRDACLAVAPCTCRPGLDGGGWYHAHDCRSRDPRPAFFFKQWGEWTPTPMRNAREVIALYPDGQRLGARNTADEWFKTTTLLRVGKTRAGRDLDGRIWDEFPSGNRGSNYSRIIPVNIHTGDVTPGDRA